ncbi:hypothetical protein AnigIFM56816_005844 [Aspergillus niger]|nr:hypothetical protein AnigIFM56816_005844 [Aspergillus niger]
MAISKQAQRKVSRRSHQKSRLGCNNCKRRHIKCDELRPQCINCMNHSVICEYSPSTSLDMQPLSARASQSSLSAKSERLINWIFVPSEYQSTSRRPIPDSITKSVSWTSTGAQSSPSPSSNLPSPSPSSSQPTPTPTTFDFYDFTLHHHYLTSTCYTLAEDDGSLHFWRDEAPKLAITHPFILHLILALAGLHKARINSDHALSHREENGSLLVNKADHHSAIGLSELLSRVGHIQPDNIQAVWVGATILCFLPMARGPRPGDYLFFSAGTDHESMAEWPSLVRGVKTLSGISGDIKPRGKNNTPSPVNEGGKALGMDYRGSLEALRERILLPGQEREEVNGRDLRDCYFNAIDMLERMLDEMCGERQDEGECKIGRLAMIIYDWICCFEDGLDAFQRKEPVALILLSYFLVLMKLHDGVWFARGWAEHIMGGIEEGLDQDDRRWLHWPMEEIGMHNGAGSKAGTIIAPSNPINNFSFRIVELVHPCSNSIVRYTLRIYIKRTENTIAENKPITIGMCALPRRDGTSRQNTRQAKSAPRATKTVIATSWKMMPPTMMWVPVDWELEEEEEVSLVSNELLLEDESPPPPPDEAIPPPAAWTTKEIISQVQKIQRCAPVLAMGYLTYDEGSSGVVKIPKHPSGNTEHHQVRNHAIWTVWPSIEAPKRATKVEAAASEGT